MITSSNRTAFQATLHCLTGCAIGEVLGMVISTALGWPALPSIIFAISLAFLFGYTLSVIPLLRARVAVKKALALVLAADTLSIATMELVDNGFIMMVPGAIHAGLDTVLFWTSLLLSLVVAFIVAFPVNKYLIAKGMGHAVVHDYHTHHHESNHHHEETT